ncbi:MAG: molybdopterin molybdotransferase MoeA [Gammaproteobacteria bacterium]|nr:molybdopterin molybdotransferase MoeA [Gammaproteobacteria bacterium]
MSARRRIEVGEAAALIQQHMPGCGDTRVAIADATGTILRETVTAERDQPPFDRVTMDGIAIRAAGVANGSFTVRGIQAAGAPPTAVDTDDACVEIMTGASLPPGADTIVPVERISRDGDRAVLESGYTPEHGQFIHPRGSDHREGQTLLSPGTRIGGPEMAVLTIAGKTEIRVARWPRIAVISTGDELVDIGEPIQEFQIRSSNDRAIAAALELHGCRTAVRARLPDDISALRATIGELHDTQEMLILSGGVSMGKYDYVPQILEELQVELVFHKILQKPGLPMWFGVSAAGKPVFALPGNPVSSLVCVARYILPALELALGLDRPGSYRVRLAEALEFRPDLTCLMPVQLEHGRDGEFLAVPRPTNTSGDFVSLAGTDGIVELPRGQDAFPAGFIADFYAW